ncbi:trypsin-like serine peptidase [Sorangium sp. So ce385]|uniref:trypsin-like serine peptidase n=1 Tax=Sorangium sp. So ce385 TaxID=3133308 RepID=UPI003F5C9291
MRPFLMAYSVLCCCDALHCTDDGGPVTYGEAGSSVVYGRDDRKEQRDYPVGSPIDGWARSSAIVVARSALHRSGDSGIALGAGEALSAFMESIGRPLCPEEPFKDEPVLGGFCSAFLVASDLLITAGHCVSAPGVCPHIAFVFGASYDRPGRDPSRVGPDDVYLCRDIRKLAARGEQGDYAVVRLDRPVVGREPLRLRRAGKVDDDEELILIGNPMGLPTKIAAHGEVLDNASACCFKASTDSYGGGSGSVVLGANSRLVEGVLVRGETDFVEASGCWASKVCPTEGSPCRGEDVTRASEFAASVPEGACARQQPRSRSTDRP